jgi:H+-translocating NAD(P) transhydrogenase subunit alpha
MTSINTLSNPYIAILTIFILACFVGYYVVWKVTPSLHTPLMSLTNAISSIIILGALIAAGSQVRVDKITLLGGIAIFITAINIFGGFVVTQRMLRMYKRSH